MKIGVPKEIKDNEKRVGLIPSGARELVHAGCEVFVENNAGAGIGISNNEYKKAGAKILNTASEVFKNSQMIIKVKEPLPDEISMLNKDHILYTFLHLAADRELTQGLMKSGCTAVAYETVQTKNGNLPLLMPMSEVAGRMATQVGASFLQSDKEGKGVLLGGVPGVKRSRVTVIGCGIAGTNAIKVAMGMGADVVAIDINQQRLAELDDLFEAKITTLFSNQQNIEESVISSDLLIGAVLIPGAKAPCLVTKQMIEKMEPGSVVVDVAVDQGGCIETCNRPTTHNDPIYKINGIIHYCVSNMPGAISKTSTYALTNATLKYAKEIAIKGIEKASSDDAALKLGINIYKGNLVYQQIAKDLALSYTPLSI